MTPTNLRRWGAGFRDRRVSRASVAAGIIALATAFALSARADLASSPWPMFGHDARHTGLSPFSAGANPLKLKWQFTTGTAAGTGGFTATSPPAIGADGTIYVGSSTYFDDQLYAISPDGSERWEFSTGGPVVTSPAIAADGTIYMSTYRPVAGNNFFAINPDGTQKWALNVGQFGTGFSSPAIGADGTIYFCSFLGNVLEAVADEGKSAEVKWQFNPVSSPNGAYLSPAIGADGTIYYGNQNLYAVNPDGSPKWQFHTDGGFDLGSPAIGADGTIYVDGGKGGSLYAINPDGTEKWQFSDGAPIFFEQIPAIGPDGTIYTVGLNSDGLFVLYAVKPDGSLKWQLAGAVAVGPWLVIGPDGTIYTPSPGGDGLYAINPDGTVKSKVPIGTSGASVYVTLSPAIGADGTVYVGSIFGSLDGASFGGELNAVGPGQADAALYLSTSSIDFGTVGTDTGTSTESFSINNVGTTALGVTVNASGPFKVTGAGSLMLTPNQPTPIVATLTPPTQSGSLKGRIDISAGDGEARFVSVSAFAQGPSLSVPTTLNFCKVRVGHSKTMTLNITDAALGVLTGSVDASGLRRPFAAVSGAGQFQTTSSTSHAVTIKFAPRAARRFKGTITVTGNDQTHPSVTVTVTGRGR